MVRSLLNFFPQEGKRLVDTEQAAYEYWLRRANACYEAEKAYGRQTIYRLRYSDLIGDQEAAMRSLLEFLGEPYAAECLEPFAQRINSSNVPADFDEQLGHRSGCHPVREAERPTDRPDERIRESRIR